MEFREDRQTTLREMSPRPSPVDISKVEASDSVQSYLSTSTSSKRIKISANTNPPFVGNTSKIALLGPYPQDSESIYSLMRTSLSSNQAPLAQEVPRLSSGRSTRLERSWPRYIIKYALCCYCFLSCIMASLRLYTGLFHKRVNGERVLGSEHYSTRTLERYLLRSTAPSVTLEPFVLFAKPSKLNKVTICAWLSESEIHHIERWLESWHDPISLLVTTTTAPSSVSHASLLIKMRDIRPNLSAAGLSIHLLHIDENEDASPNLYLNLATVFAQTNWTLLFPGGLDTLVPQSMQQALDTMNWKAEEGVRLLSSSSESYSFQGLPPLLIRNDLDFWCTERSFIGVSRESDWDECLWQIALTMNGRITMGGVGPMSATDTEKKNRFEEETRQRLSAKFRAEACDTYIKQVAIVYPRGRQRQVALDWANFFCTKVIFLPHFASS